MAKEEAGQDTWFQTPRVWGGEADEVTLSDCLISDPTRVGRGNLMIWTITRNSVSDPTRVGRGRSGPSATSSASFRPHACGEGQQRQARAGTGRLSDPTRVGRGNEPWPFPSWEEFQTPRVWGGECENLDCLNARISDPTRVGRGNSSVATGRPSCFRPHACGEGPHSHLSGCRMRISDPTRVGRGRRPRPGPAAAHLSDPTRVGRATWHLRAWSWTRLLRLPARIPRHARVAAAPGHQTPRVWGAFFIDGRGIPRPYTSSVSINYSLLPTH